MRNEAQETLIGILLDQGRPREAVPLARSLYEADWPNRDAQSYLATHRARVYADCLRAQGDYVQARRLEADVLAIVLRVLPEIGDGFGLGEAQPWAEFLDEQGELAAAEKLWRFSLDQTRRLARPNHPDLTHGLFAVALFLRDHGHAEEALPLVEEVLAIRREAWGLNHQDTLSAQLALARTQRKLGNSRQALQTAREAHGNAVGMYGDGIQTREASGVLSELLADHRQFAEAEELLRGRLRQLSETLPVADPRLWQAYLDLADFLMRQGNLAEASSLLESALSSLAPSLPANSWRLAELRGRLGACYSQQGQSLEAETALRDSLAVLEHAFNSRHTRVRQAVTRLAAHYEAAGDTDSAARVRARLDAGQPASPASH
jgi:tetratricopeptide (TPR) repeat protein